MRYFFAIVLLMSSTVSAQKKTSTLEDFQEYAKRMSGRFSSEITLIHDWPGNKKKKGDVIHGVRHGAIDVDGSALVLTDAAGAGIGKEICAYNAATKQIESFIVFNGGTVFHAVTWKESSDQWNWSLKGSLANGDKISGHGYWKFSDGGKKLELISDDFTIGGKQADKLHDKYIRVAN
jgi:hypothetical protein